MKYTTVSNYLRSPLALAAGIAVPFLTAGLAHAKPPTVEVTAPNTLPAWLSAVWVFGLGVLAVAAAIVFAFIKYRRYSGAAREANQAEAGAESRVAEAGRRVLVGTVSAVDGKIGSGFADNEAAAVEIEQRAKLAGEDSIVGWSEVKRRQRQRPFTLKLDSGASLRVEPDNNSRIIDDLDELEQVDDYHRVRRARLVVGQRVFASGMVYGPMGGGPYRGGGEAVMRAGGGDALVVSTRPLAEALTARASVHRVWIVVLLVALLANTLIVHRDYLSNALFSRSVYAKVVGRTVLAGQSPERFELKVRVPGVDKIQTVEVSRELFMVGQIGSKVPMHKIEGKLAQPGRHAGSSPWSVLLSLGLMLLLVAGYIVHLRSSLPWYERAEVSGMADAKTGSAAGVDTDADSAEAKAEASGSGDGGDDETA